MTRRGSAGAKKPKRRKRFFVDGEEDEAESRQGEEGEDEDEEWVP